MRGRRRIDCAAPKNEFGPSQFLHEDLCSVLPVQHEDLVTTRTRSKISVSPRLWSWMHRREISPMRTPIPKLAAVEMAREIRSHAPSYAS